MLRCSGIRTHDASGSTTSSASIPSRPPPSALAWWKSESGPLCQVGKKLPITRSPAFHRVTPAPTVTTSPAPSETGMSGACRVRCATLRSR
jgi:hypothetical protein